MVVTCLLNDLRRHLLNSDCLALMKPTAHIINVARGPIVEASIEAQRKARIAGAGPYVLEQEPRDAANPLFAMDNAISTAHSSAGANSFVDARDEISDIINPAGRPISL